MDKMHSLLRRQLKKIFGSADNVPKDFEKIIGVINEAYFNFDEDRLLLERSIEISSRELLEANAQMRSIFQALPDMFLRIDADGKILECKIPANKTFSHIKPNEIVGKSIYASFGQLAARRLEWAVRRAVKNKTVEVAEYSVQNQIEQFREARVVWIDSSCRSALTSHVRTSFTSGLPRSSRCARDRRMSNIEPGRSGTFDGDR